MKNLVLLYNPVSEFYAMPLGLLAVASALDRSRFEVQIIDGRLVSQAHDLVLEKLDRAHCLGMTVFTGSPIEDALSLSIKVKSKRSGLPVIWGGWHPSLMPEQCLESGVVDAVVLGQGEATFTDLVDRWSRAESLAGCRGCLFVDQGRIVRNQPRSFQDVNSFPPADYGLLDLPAYFRKKKGKRLDYCSSRGCPYKCTFCADPQVYGGRWSGLAPERVVSELLQLHSRHCFDEVFFLDDDLFANRQRLAEICARLAVVNPGFGWKGTARADELCRLTDASLSAIKRSGCLRINVGAESGSQVMLDRIQKKYRVEQLIQTGHRCNDYGIKLTYSFIAGFPGEPPETLGQTVSVIRGLKEINPEFETPIYFYAPYPGTELAEGLAQYDWTLGSRLEDWFRFDIRKEHYPWTTPDYVRQVKNLNFYLQKAYPTAPRSGPVHRLVRRLAHWRLSRGVFGWPVERHAFGMLRRLWA